MANIIKLVKCDQKAFQGRIDQLRLVVEGVSVKVFLVVTAASLGCMIEKMVTLGILSGMVAITSLIAYGYSQNIARFIVLDLEKREVLVLTVMPKHGQEAGNY
jgi:predicted Na+-dependent transporter